MKGRYNIYPRLTDTSMRLMRKSSTEHKTITTCDCLKLLFETLPEMRQALNYTILSEEHYWRKHSRVVIFPESCEVLTHLMKAKFNITLPSGFSFPHESFFLAFPQGFNIEGRQVNGCMISYMYRQERLKKMHQPFLNYLGFPNIKVTDESHERGLYFAYINPFNEGEVIRCSIRTDSLIDCLKAETAQEYGRLIGEYDLQEVEGFAPLNGDELKYQFQLFQIIARIGLYTSFCNSALRDGYPHVRPKHLEPKGLAYVDQTLSMAAEHTKGLHYRSCYFRQLTHKKYYQGVHAKKPIGSRIVFVKDTMIGKTVEAQTLL